MKPTRDFGVHAEPKTRQESCPEHGQFVARCHIGSIWTKCPGCVATETAAEADEATAKQREEARLAWQRRIGGAGIPARFRDRSLRSFVATTDAQARALAFAQAYADQFDQALATGRSAMLLGRPGTGKTHLAAAIGLRIMHRDNRTVLFTTVVRAIRRVRDTWTRGSAETETQAIAALTSPDLLILDEVGVQYGSEAEKLVLFDVLNERYECRRPTLLLSNLALEEVRLYLGERVFDRLREDGGEVVVFGWESHRARTGT